MVDIRNTNLNSLSKGELITIIYKLFEENELLRIRISDLEEKLNQKGKPGNLKRNSSMGKSKRKKQRNW